LFIANYGSNPVNPAVPTGNPSIGVFSTWAFWQYGSQGRVDGIGGGTANVDVDVANGDISFVQSFVIGVPEPSAMILGLVGGAAMTIVRGQRRRQIVDDRS
jgi:GH25 family lysozyme M1 (1,4-beta-N-acetylmuramidase)